MRMAAGCPAKRNRTPILLLDSDGADSRATSDPGSVHIGHVEFHKCVAGAKYMKRLIRYLLRSVGYDITRHRQWRLGLDPFEDMRYFTKGIKRPIIFDVGANKGQSVDNFKRMFPDSSMHSFEPSPRTYAELSDHCKALDGVKTWNYGVGSSPATLPFLENNYSDMSSFLAPDDTCWGTIEATTHVEVLTLDSFASTHNVGFIDILKSDTQGYEYHVFKGAEGLMRQNRIGILYFEFIFSRQYKDLPSFDEVFRFLLDHNFSLVTFYEPHFQHDLLSWTDMLFINAEYKRHTVEQGAAANNAEPDDRLILR
jgi:FkbM family methyltransferase